MYLNGPTLNWVQHASLPAQLHSLHHNPVRSQILYIHMQQTNKPKLERNPKP